MKNIFLRLKNNSQARRFISDIFNQPEDWNMEAIKEQAIEILDNPEINSTTKSYARIFAEGLKILVARDVKHVPHEGEERAKLVKNGREIKF